MKEITLSFKAGVDPEEYQYLHPTARAACELLSLMLSEMGFNTEVTSILRPAGTIAKESGVHATLRAIDVVPRGKNPTSAKMQTLAKAMNEIYERADGKPFCLWHDGTGWHFHLQAMKTPGWIDAKGHLDEHKRLLKQMKLT